MKILLDMNLLPAWVSFLTDAGHEAIRWSTVGAPDAHDVEVMSWAAAHGHVVPTSDLDFGAILAATQVRRPSVVQLRTDILTFEAIGTILLAALRQLDEKLSNGALVSIEPARARLRILPLKD